jgi:hypothetical protein
MVLMGFGFSQFLTFNHPSLLRLVYTYTWETKHGPCANLSMEVLGRLSNQLGDFPTMFDSQSYCSIIELVHG